MFVLFLLAAADDGTTPRIGKPVGDISRWFNERDYRDLQGRGAVRFKVLFSKEGVPTRCTIEASTGNAEVEALACRRVHERFRFQPSHDTDGQQVPHVFVRSVKFGRFDSPAFDAAAQAYAVAIAGAGKEERFGATIDVGPTGVIQGCTARGPRDTVVSGKAVCDALAASWQPLVERDAADEPIRYVRGVSVVVKKQ